MKVMFIPSEEFMRQFKRLAKKYPSLVSDYDTFKKELHESRGRFSRSLFR